MTASYLDHMPYLIEGVVVDTADPQEMGRIKVWCPAVDGELPKLEVLPWATYMSPLAGQAHDYPAGGGASRSEGPVSYGFWAIPKLGAQVVIAFLYGDVNQRIYMGSMFRDHGNRSLPAGRNTSAAPVSDSNDKIEPQTSNLGAQFQGKLDASEARTRGAYERQAAQALSTKTDAEGYNRRVIKAADPTAGLLESQLYCWTTPGRHAIIMQDNPSNARVRLKTAEGHQIILDDANERIYVSTSRGRTWIELDVDGHVNIYAAESISMSAGKDFNIEALGNINLSAGGNVNIAGGGHARISACSDVSLSGDGGINLTSGGTFNVLAAGTLLATGSEIHLNGPGAATAPCADKPSITPSHEPWTRAPAATKRGSNWKA